MQSRNCDGDGRAEAALGDVERVSWSGVLAGYSEAARGGTELVPGREQVLREEGTQ